MNRTIRDIVRKVQENAERREAETAELAREATRAQLENMEKSFDATWKSREEVAKLAKERGEEHCDLYTHYHDNYIGFCNHIDA